MPALLPFAAVGLGAVVVWEWATGAKGETETVAERISTNLGAVALAVAGAVGVAWVWRRGRR